MNPICFIFYFSKTKLNKKVKASSYIAQYPVLMTFQCPLHFTSLTDLFTQTPSRLLWEASSHMLQLMREGCLYTYPPLYIASCIQLSELEQCRVKKRAQGFNTAAQDSNPGSRSRESEALPLSHCALPAIPLSHCAQSAALFTGKPLAVSVICFVADATVVCRCQVHWR